MHGASARDLSPGTAMDSFPDSSLIDQSDAPSALPAPVSAVRDNHKATLLQPGSIVTFWDESGRLLKACQEGKYWQLYPVEDGDGPATPEGAVKRVRCIPLACLFAVEAKDPRYYGFRSLGAEGRFLQAVRESSFPHRVANYNFGAWECWERCPTHGLVNVAWAKALGWEIHEVRAIPRAALRDTELAQLKSARLLRERALYADQRAREADRAAAEEVAALEAQLEESQREARALAEELAGARSRAAALERELRQRQVVVEELQGALGAAGEEKRRLASQLEQAREESLLRAPAAFGAPSAVYEPSLAFTDMEEECDRMREREARVAREESEKMREREAQVAREESERMREREAQVARLRREVEALKTSVSSGGNPLTRSRDSDPHASQRQSAERVPTLQTDTDADLAAGATGDDADVAAAAADVALVAVTALPPRQVVGSPPRASVLRPLPDVRTPPRYPEGVMDADAEGRGGADVIGLDRLGRMMAAVGLTQDTPPSMRGAEEEPVPIAFRDGGALSFRARADRQRMDAEGEAGTANSNTNIGTSSTATRAAPPSPTFVARPVGPSRGAEYDFDSGRPGGDSGDGNEGVARECAVLDGALSWGEPPARTAPPEVKLRQRARRDITVDLQQASAAAEPGPSPRLLTPAQPVNVPEATPIMTIGVPRRASGTYTPLASHPDSSPPNAERFLTPQTTPASPDGDKENWDAQDMLRAPTDRPSRRSEGNVPGPSAAHNAPRRARVGDAQPMSQAVGQGQGAGSRERGMSKGGRSSFLSRVPLDEVGAEDLYTHHLGKFP